MRLISNLINLIFNHFSIFLLIVSIFLLTNKVFLFKTANDFKITNLEEKAFTNYLKHKKINVFTQKIEKIKKDILFQNIAKNQKVIKKFDEKVFYQELKNYKDFLNFVYKVLGFSLLFLVYKFFKRVRF